MKPIGGTLAVQDLPCSPCARTDGHSDNFCAADFDARVCPHLPTMVAVATRILGSEDLAWDAVQDVLLRIWQKGWLHDPPERALRHLVKMRSLHLRRGAARRLGYELACPLCSQAESVRTELEELERKEAQAQVLAALRRLAPESRSVVELYDLYGHSYDEIARQLAIPLGTVRSRLSRARQKLRAVLEAAEHEAGDTIRHMSPGERAQCLQSRN